jgi:hypothetical protein
MKEEKLEVKTLQEYHEKQAQGARHKA